MHPQPFREEDFWAAGSDWFLHLPSILARIRRELSGEAPITLEEIWRIAITEMGYSHHQTLFEADEIARPLSLVAAVWAYKALGLPADKARSFGFFIGTWAGGDAFFGGSRRLSAVVEFPRSYPIRTGRKSSHMKIPLSVLDLSPVVSGSTASEALRNTLDLARLTDRLGYTRYWLAEHHNTPSIASSAPEIMIGQVARETARIRVGSGGIMLPNHAPLKVAEWFRTLEALFPGRIDLGIGRAPGTDQRTALALRRSPSALRAEDFPARLEEMFRFTTGDFPADHPFRSVVATPADVPLPPVWLLGSSLFSAHLSAELGLGFGFAHHFSPHDAVEAMQIYRRQFSPSTYLAEPHAILTIAVICAETDEEADYLASSQDLFWVQFQRGHFGPLPSPEEATSYQYTPAEQMLVQNRRAHIFVGRPATILPRIQALAEHTRADEVMVTTQMHSQRARLRCYELLAEAYGLEGA